MRAKSSSKRTIDYKKRYQIIKRIINFKYDLRKPFTSGQKAAITRTFEAMVTYKNKRFIPITKSKKETWKQYKQKLNNAKSAYGQTIGGLKYMRGVFVDVPKGVKTKVEKDGTVVFITKRFKEWVIEADANALIDDDFRDLYLEELWFENNFNYIYINYSGHARSDAYAKEDDDNDNPVLDKLKEDVSLLVYRYKDNIELVISGFIFRKCAKGHNSCYE